MKLKPVFLGESSYGDFILKIGTTIYNYLQVDEFTRRRAKSILSSKKPNLVWRVLQHYKFSKEEEVSGN